MPLINLHTNYYELAEQILGKEVHFQAHNEATIKRMQHLEPPKSTLEFRRAPSLSDDGPLQDQPALHSTASMHAPMTGSTQDHIWH